MITSFKIFEYRNDYKRKYNVGDYVVLDFNNLKRVYITDFNEGNYFEYEGIEENGDKAIFRYSHIIRKLTDEEKADFELKINASKYNL
jgi:hypothetical protein